LLLVKLTEELNVQSIFRKTWTKSVRYVIF